MSEKSVLLVAHERVVARADEFMAAYDAGDLGGALNVDGLVSTLKAYGLDWREIERFCADAVDSILVAVRGGADIEQAIGSIVMTTLLTGVELAEDRSREG
jgi:hypothetical protein